MFFGIPRKGQRISWEIAEASKPDAKDLYPGRINDVQGRQVSLFVLRRNSDGTPRLDHVLTTVNFIEARHSLVEEIDSVTLQELGDNVMAEKLAYQAQRSADASLDGATA